MAQGSSNKKIANRLVGASCAAVLAVYTAGYSRTQSAANRLAAQVAERRSAVPAQQRVVLPGPGTSSSAPIPVRLLPPPPPMPATRAVATSHAAPSSPRADSKFDARGSVAEPAPIETPEPLPQVAAPAVAAASALPPPPAPARAKPAWKDGTYTGWGYSRHGNIEAAVVIEGGRILSASISQCRTRYSCDVIDKLIPQVAQRQSPEVDYVSGATQSADAFYGAVVEALAKAQ